VSEVQRTRAALAQNLFASANPARRLVALAGISPGDRVYDLGAGTGLITGALVDAGARVVAVERDPNLARRLRARFAAAPGVTVLEADLAEVRFRAPYKVVANPPFNRTAALLRRLLGDAPAPETAALVLQREAARKWAGVPRPTAVSLAAAPWFELSVSEPFRRRDFTPAPGVDLALLRFARRAVPDLEHDCREAWAGFVRHAFGRGRADARGAFRGLLSHLQWRRLSAELGVGADARLAELGYDDWLAIFGFATAHTPLAKRRKAGMTA
jgi:16S rRNA A1518/A1519 N6-dimethyltransferase RsmA/KsgA/DIM1 with predicted DNA glycosylase/AP lyase activity